MTRPTVYLVTENSGLGSSFIAVGVYTSRESAKQHVSLAKSLMPGAANKLQVVELPLLDAVPGVQGGEAA